MRNQILLLACLAVLAACDKAAAPPDPATSAAAREGARHHELKDAMEANGAQEKAKRAADPTLEADKKHDEQLEKDSGG